jgi:carbamoyl-phosphate synthase large subunit
MNPRVSRSSALASKATGFPIAKVAAKLAVGYTLDELRNEITGGATPASFEPAIDYVVTKIPRFAFEKFPAASPILTTQMKSVGEAMSIGRTFQESMQKALRSLETGRNGFDEILEGEEPEARAATLRRELREAGAERVLYVADAFREGLSLEQIYELTHIDRWFLAQIEDLVRSEEAIRGPAEAQGVLRRAPGAVAGRGGGPGQGLPPSTRYPAGVQASRHLCRGIRYQYGLHVLDL